MSCLEGGTLHSKGGKMHIGMAQYVPKALLSTLRAVSYYFSRVAFQGRLRHRKNGTELPYNGGRVIYMVITDIKNNLRI